MSRLNLTGPELAGLLGLVAAFAVLSLWSIRDAFNRQFRSTNEKMIWIQLCVLVPFLGAIVYLIWGKKRGEKTK
jgi:drug/metabolite transporter (DMT)-like permease